MKSIMQSIQPKWCELIVNGRKTIEVRKTRPKIDPPFKVYMYCTKSRDMLWTLNKNERIYSPNKIADIFTAKSGGGVTRGNGKVIGEYICDNLIQIGYNKNGYGLDDLAINGVIAKSCVEEKELYSYLKKDAKPYLYHISDLVIYDKPKELGEFKRPCLKISPCETCRYSVNNDLPFGEISIGCDRRITRSPQSWYYVEELRR